ncbi:MAG TPA: amino acid adenylation domain-containing protein [Candidatus Angelobacter sp.]|nr:amino acid adenylation domain-containing protein [Candidatus Angelobacter sp.]
MAVAPYDSVQTDNAVSGSSAESCTFPLSAGQKQLWMIQQLDPGSATYNTTLYLRLWGSLDISALESSFTEIVRRHEILRTTFPMRENEPVQQIHPPITVKLSRIDLSGLSGDERVEMTRLFRQREAVRAFDLAAGPLLRVCLIVIEPQVHELLVTMHHIIRDGWSRGILVKELSVLYNAYCHGKPPLLPGLPIQYVDYAVWQQRWLANGAMEKQREYWRKQLADAPVLELPTDYPRSKDTGRRAGELGVAFEKEMSDGVARLAQQEGATLFMVLLAGFQWLLGRYSGQSDISVGVVSANRTRQETARLIGFFANTLVMRTSLEGQPTFRELLRRVRRVALDAYAHQDVPFEKLVKDLNPVRLPGRTPFFETMFSVNNAEEGGVELDGLAVEPINDFEFETAKFDLTLQIAARKSGIVADLQYAAGIFRRDSMERFLDHYQRILERATAQPDLPLTEISLFTEAETDQSVVQWNRTEREYADHKCVHQLFEHKARQHPDAVAVMSGQERVTYSDLNRKANQLAWHLRKLGVGPETRVAICMERSIQVVECILGILKAGGAYVPLDPDLPAERLEFMLQDIQPKIVLTQEAFKSQIEQSSARIICLPEVRHELAGEMEDDLPCQTDGGSLAYVMCTSGSTGRPKGIMICHRSISRLVLNTDYVSLDSRDVFLQFAPVSFDASTFEIWGCLLNGGRLVIPASGKTSVEELGRQIKDHQVSVLWLTAGLFHQVIEQSVEKLAGVRQLLAGGDVLSTRHVRRAGEVLKNTRLINGYGPTENTTFSCCYGMSGAEIADLDGTVPIGKPISNTRAYVLDPQMRPVPPGIKGELYLGGAGLARGYWARPELTAERFVPDPFSGSGGRLYRTGDQVLWRNDGNLEFLGRLDQQVKLRGYRIELGEIEMALNQYPGVEQAVVLVREDKLGEKVLSGYVVGRPGTDLKGIDIRSRLKDQLPEYMVPSAVVVLNELPLTMNGKVDRRVLPAPGLDDTQKYVAPHTEVEETLCRIWANILGLERVGVEDNFFESGGHSLLATRMMSQVRNELRVEVPLRILFDEPTVRELAKQVEAMAGSHEGNSPKIEKALRSGDLPLSAAQQRMWFLHQLQPGSTAYNIPLNLRLTGNLSIEILEKCLSEIVRRHEILRTTFPDREGRATQHIHPAGPVRLALADLSGVQGESKQMIVRDLRQAEAQRPFDLVQGPLMRAHLLRLSEQEHELLLSMHHIVGDGWSLDILLGELQALWIAYHEGLPSPLPELEIQYADFAVWQQQWLQSATLQQQLNYWRKQLVGVPVLDLPTDRPRLQKVERPRRRHTFQLSTELSKQLNNLSRREGVSLFMVMLAGFQWLLSRYANQEDVAVGTVLANRTHQELEGLVGFFVNTLVLRTNLCGLVTFKNLLQSVRETTLQAYAHQDVPFAKLVEELNPERNLGATPLFQAMIAFQNIPLHERTFPDLQIEVASPELADAKFELTLTLWEGDSFIRGNMDYAADLFDEESIAQMMKHYLHLMEKAVESLDVPLDTPIATSEEQKLLVTQWNRTERENDHGRNRCVPELFELQVKRTPKAIAVCHEAVQWSYAELNHRANQLAHYLRSCGAELETRIGVYLDRNLDLAAAMMGIWKAGGVYVPLDTAYPKERLAYMLEDSRVEILLTEQGLSEELGLCTARVIYLDLEWNTIESQNGEDGPDVRIGPKNLAYLMYTSGSTGRPKGAMVEHGGMSNHLWAKVEDLGLTGDDVVAQNAPSSFDISVWQMLAVLLVGGQVQILGDDVVRDALELQQEVERTRITVLETVPTMLGILIEQHEHEGENRPFKGLRWMISNAEALPVTMCRHWARLYPQVALLNTYGATECSDDISHCMIDPSCGNTWAYAPLGAPISNMQVYVLDEAMNPVPIEVKGELYLGGTGVGRGYLNKPIATARQFVPNPFASRTGERLYRTGDLGRRLRDGSLEFSERRDHQVKIRGHRIELGEIEAALLDHEAIEQAVVLAREDQPGDRRLVAYFVPSAFAKDPGKEQGSDQERIDRWQNIFDEIYGNGAESFTGSLINSRVWTSSYAEKTFTEKEILSCVEETASRILALKPRRVLEIGCGTGLVLARIAPHCEEYYGTDISQLALTRLQNWLDMRGLAKNVKLLQRSAEDQSGIPADYFDLVVINEVVQYFPSMQYFIEVLNALRTVLAPGGAIYLGDLRNLDLMEVFHSSVELSRAPGQVKLAELRRRIKKRTKREKELLVAPGFFQRLQKESGWIQRIDIELKGGPFSNELTKFRYDAVLHIGDSGPETALMWMDWKADRLNLMKIEELLSGNATGLAITGIPNRRLWGDVRALALMEDMDEESTVAELQSRLEKSLSDEESLDPEQLRKLQGLRGRVQVSWSSSGALGSFQVVLQAPLECPANGNEAQAKERRPLDAGAELWRAYSNQPSQEKTGDGLIEQIRSYLVTLLPEYQIPSAWVVLEAIPLTANGKIDRNALPAPEQSAVLDNFVAPRNELETVLCGLWSQLLHLSQVGIHDNFFALGGHSLMATQLIARIRSSLQKEISLAALFRSPTVAGLAAEVEQSQGKNSTSVVLQIKPADRQAFRRQSIAN